MEENAKSEILALVERTRRRLCLSLLWNGLLRGFFWGGIAATLYSVWIHFFPPSLSQWAFYHGIGVLLCVLAGGIAGAAVRIRQFPTTEETAVILDRRGGLEDRLSTLFGSKKGISTFSGNSSENVLIPFFDEILLEQLKKVLADRPVEQAIHFRGDRRGGIGLLIALAAAGGVFLSPFHFTLGVEDRPPELPERVHRKMEVAVRKLEKKGDGKEAKPEEKLAREMKKLNAELKEGKISLKEAMAEAARMKREMEKSLKGRQEQKRSMRRLEESEGGRELADKLREGLDREQRQALSSKWTRMESQERESLASKLREAGSQWKGNEQAQKGFENLADSLKEGNFGNMDESLRELAESMKGRDPGREGSFQPGEGEASSGALAEALRTMQELEESLRGQGQGEGEGSGEGEGEGEGSGSGGGSLEALTGGSGFPGSGEMAGSQGSDISTNLEGGGEGGKTNRKDATVEEEWKGLYESERIKGEVQTERVKGKFGKGKAFGSIEFHGAPSRQEGDVSYEEAATAYRQVAREALDNQQIPKEYEEWVKEYFELEKK